MNIYKIQKHCHKNAKYVEDKNAYAMCGCEFEHAKLITLYLYYRKNISSRLVCNSEANASELQTNLEEMFPR